jgi:hypothetical protein
MSRREKPAFRTKEELREWLAKLKKNRKKTTNEQKIS